MTARTDCGYDPRGGLGPGEEVCLGASGERIVLAGLLVATFALRAVHADQPIVENYVGRQVPTAMVARNLERGSDLLHPRLDTGPGDLFLVEPPIFAVVVVGVRHQTGLALEPAGRLTSALATALAAWGLHGLVRRREGPMVALVAVGAFAAFPLTLRYGRAFQPDALMVGLLIAGLRCWDEAESGDGRWRWFGWSLLATGLTTKVTSAYILLPLAMITRSPRRWEKVAFATLALVPAMLWYAHAARLIAHDPAAQASAVNAQSWRDSLLPPAVILPKTYAHVARFLIVRAFTPLGFVLATWGWTRLRSPDRLWPAWTIAASLALAILAGKLDHEYYFLALAPLAAVALARALVDLAGMGTPGRAASVAIGVLLVALSARMSASTWTTPPEWTHLNEAAAIVRQRVPRGDLLIAPEPLLYYSDRCGYRLEVEPAAVQRAKREHSTSPYTRRAASRVRTAADLIAFELRSRNARYVADLIRPSDDPRRRELHEALRAGRIPRAAILVDRPGVLILAGPRSE